VQHEARQVTIRLLGCAGPVVLPQFYFPGWVGPDGLPPPVADPKTGLMLITVPAGTDQVVLRRTLLPEEILGRTITLAAATAWMLAGLTGFGGILLLRQTPRSGDAAEGAGRLGQAQPCHQGDQQP
jgi:hypothetical protein